LVTAAASLFAEILVSLISFALEICLYILIASIRPWRYLLSPTFRAKINAQHASKSALSKWWHLICESVLLIASAGLAAGLILLWPQLASDTKPQPGLRQQAIEKSEQVLLDRIKKRQGIHPAN